MQTMTTALARTIAVRRCHRRAAGTFRRAMVDTTTRALNSSGSAAAMGKGAGDWEGRMSPSGSGGDELLRGLNDEEVTRMSSCVVSGCSAGLA